jgi:hypothetical protein
MQLLSAGAIVLLVTVIAFWVLLPRGERTHRFVDTELEPYIAVALTAMVALAFTLLLSGALNYAG